MEEKYVQIFYHTKDHLVYSFLRKRMVGGDDPFYEILGQTDRFGAKSPIFSRYSLAAPQA